MKDKHGNPINIGDHIEFEAQIYSKTSDGIYIVPSGSCLTNHAEVMKCREYFDFFDFSNLFSNDTYPPKRGETVETDVYQITNCFPGSNKVEFCKIVGERYDRFTVKATFIKKVQHNEIKVE